MGRVRNRNPILILTLVFCGISADINSSTVIYRSLQSNSERSYADGYFAIKKLWTSRHLAYSCLRLPIFIWGTAGGWVEDVRPLAVFFSARRFPAVQARIKGAGAEGGYVSWYTRGPFCLA